ncbi:MAG: hypothetical protein DSY98_05910 [SAR324 cluster bacterium]|uniref:Uncharacterized protein n=1 Tax=SAR324 cluster bacterium TaxID=2024889 RepID=A0A432G789_9DELT|nr:MAG: hypothetical protein DSY98_05910 [SAR324 cluster bacterium]
MEIITWGDIRRGTLAIVLVIVPTVLLGTYMRPVQQSFHITGPGLWELKRKGAPDALIEPLHELRLKPFFFKFRLMSEVESRISDADLFKKYEKKIERQISGIAMPAVEYIFLAVLAAYYWILWFVTRRWFPDGKV